jgi:hypothetical protein
MKCNLLLGSEKMIVDYQTKRVSAINILEDFASNIFPVAIQLAVLVSFELDEGEELNHEYTLQIKLNEIEIAQQSGSLSFPEGYKNIRNITNFSALTISAPGSLSLTINSNGNELKKYTIKILPASSTKPVLVTGEKPA